MRVVEEAPKPEPYQFKCRQCHCTLEAEPKDAQDPGQLAPNEAPCVRFTCMRCGKEALVNRSALPKGWP